MAIIPTVALLVGCIITVIRATAHIPHIVLNCSAENVVYPYPLSVRPSESAAFGCMTDDDVRSFNFYHEGRLLRPGWNLRGLTHVQILQPVEGGTTYLQLNITRLDASSSGVYSCVAQLRSGQNNTATIEITKARQTGRSVPGKELLAGPVVFPRSLSMHAGNTSTVACSSSNKDVQQLRFYRDGKLLQPGRNARGRIYVLQSSRNGTRSLLLNITHFDESVAGTFTCAAQLGGGKGSTSTNFTLTALLEPAATGEKPPAGPVVFPRSSTLHAGMKAGVLCSSNNKDLEQLSFYRAGKLLRTGRNAKGRIYVRKARLDGTRYLLLNITRFDKHIAGNFSCAAQLRGDKGSASTNFSIAALPQPAKTEKKMKKKKKKDKKAKKKMTAADLVMFPSRRVVDLRDDQSWLLMCLTNVEVQSLTYYHNGGPLHPGRNMQGQIYVHKSALHNSTGLLLDLRRFSERVSGKLACKAVAADGTVERSVILERAPAVPSTVHTTTAATATTAQGCVGILSAFGCSEQLLLLDVVIVLCIVGLSAVALLCIVKTFRKISHAGKRQGLATCLGAPPGNPLLASLPHGKYPEVITRLTSYENHLEKHA